MTRADLDNFAPIITTPADNRKFLPRDSANCLQADRNSSSLRFSCTSGIFRVPVPSESPHALAVGHPLFGSRVGLVQEDLPVAPGPIFGLLPRIAEWNSLRLDQGFAIRVIFDATAGPLRAPCVCGAGAMQPMKRLKNMQLRRCGAQGLGLARADRPAHETAVAEWPQRL
jgi:hypothetical protein